jgi:hypothetical protein
MLHLSPFQIDQRDMKGRWVIGCAFASALTEEELQRFSQSSLSQLAGTLPPPT